MNEPTGRLMYTYLLSLAHLLEVGYSHTVLTPVLFGGTPRPRSEICWLKRPRLCPLELTSQYSAASPRTRTWTAGFNRFVLCPSATILLASTNVFAMLPLNLRLTFCHLACLALPQLTVCLAQSVVTIKRTSRTY